MLTDPNLHHGDRVLENERATRPITLVLIEDDPAFAQLLSDVFRHQPDLKVIGTASTVRGGLRLSRHRVPHAVLLDYHLRDGTGDTAASLIRQLVPAVRIIMMSADASGVARAAALRIGVDGYVDKCGGVRRFPDIVRQVAGLGSSEEQGRRPG